MSFDEIYSPGLCVRSEKRRHGCRRLPRLDLRQRQTRERPPTDDGGPPGGGPDVTSDTLPATTLGRLVWNRLIDGGWSDLADSYVFDVHALTNDRPYFAAYVKPADLLPRDRPAERAAGRLGLPADLGDAGRRLAGRSRPDPDPARVRLARRVQPLARQGGHGALLRLPRPRLHHRRGRADQPLRRGARQPDHFGGGPDRRDAGLLRPRQSGVGAHPRARPHHPAVHPRGHRRGVDRLRTRSAPALDWIGTLPYALRLACAWRWSRRRHS